MKKISRRRSLTKVVNSPHRSSPLKRQKTLSFDRNIELSPSSSSSNLRVSVRVRPENSEEQKNDYRNIIQVVDDTLLVFDPKTDDDSFYFHGKRQRRDLNKKAQRDHKFAFDRVFGPQHDNQEVFENTTKGLVEFLFNGYNCSAFVYGATGAGKTFTMLGSNGNPGITYRTVVELFEQMEKRKELICEVSVSYLEIYNETVVDLIRPSGAALNIREDGNNGVLIPGLSRHTPASPAELLKLLQYGNSNRTQHPTDANAESSRSHAVFQIYLKHQERSAGLTAEVRIAKLSMIDLAGSERGSATLSRASARTREGANINKSLLALGNCINALAEGSKYIPYRNSKLTRLLKDSIGGNCHTVMISNISPSSKTFEDTYNTLKYADRAKKIKVKLRKNVTSVDFHVAQYAKIVDELKEEISVLKDKLKNYEQVQEGNEKPEAEKSTHEYKSEKLEEKSLDDEQLEELFTEQKNTIRDLFMIESELKLLTVKIHHNRRVIHRIEKITSLVGTAQIQTSQRKFNKLIRILESKASKVSVDHSNLLERLSQINQKIKLRANVCSSEKWEMLTLQNAHYESTLHCQHLLQFSRLLTEETRKMDSLINLSLPSLISAHLQLKSYSNDASSNAEFQNIIGVFCGSRVMWDEKLVTTNSESNEELLGIHYFEAAKMPRFAYIKDLNESSVKATESGDVLESNDTTILDTSSTEIEIRPPTPPRHLKPAIELNDKCSDIEKGGTDSNNKEEESEIDSTMILTSPKLLNLYSPSKDIQIVRPLAAEPLNQHEEDDSPNLSIKLHKKKIPKTDVLRSVNINSTNKSSTCISVPNYMASTASSNRKFTNSKKRPLQQKENQLSSSNISQMPLERRAKRGVLKTSSHFV